ncbi:G2 and S phase-expressed protein 1 isoform X2 [Tachyglossus aculeatus]|nr:G2 and S phase-expressed protein 1 isoform X2 [Tachyglossus aculeatus]
MARPPQEPDGGQDQAVVFLADEKFDFDLSLSFSSANEDDEVFFGQLSRKERCPATDRESGQVLQGASPRPPPSAKPISWSPLAGENLGEIFKEAHSLALQIESQAGDSKANQAEGPKSQVVEKFIQEPKSKLNLFQQGKEMRKSPRSAKRETYCVLDRCLGSQPAELPAAPGQSPAPPRARGGVGLPGPAHQAPLSSLPSFCGAAEHVAAQPLRAGGEKKATSRLQPPKSSSAQGKSNPPILEKPKPGKKTSPSSKKNGDVRDAAEAQLPDRTEATLDGNVRSVAQVKRALPVPSKFGLRKAETRFRAVAPVGKSVTASVSSVSGPSSGWNSSVAVAGKAKSGIPLNVHAASSRLPAGLSRLSRAGPGSLAPAPPRAELSEPSGQQSRPAAAGQIQGPEALPQTPDRAGRSPRDRGGRAAEEPAGAKAMPTPTSQFKLPRCCGGVTPKVPRLNRPQSCNSLRRVAALGTPARHSSAGALPGPGPLTPVHPRLGSALPTPTGRRMSGIPCVTPKTVPRPLPSSRLSLSGGPQRKSAARSEQVKGTKVQGAARLSGSSSDESLSPPTVAPLALDFSPDKKDPSDEVPTEVSSGGAEESPAEKTSLEEEEKKQKEEEVLLVDIEAVKPTVLEESERRTLFDFPLIDFLSTPETNKEVPEPALDVEAESRPLIDLSNTPEVNQNGPLKPTVPGQLIDLSSPLISLSPLANKENVDSPLLKF